MKHLVLTSILALSCTAALTPTAQAEDIMSILQRQSETTRPLPPKAIPYSYSMTVDMTETDGDDVSQGQSVLRIDPSQPAGMRVSIISADNPEGENLAEILKELEDPERNMEAMASDFWCESTDDKDNDFDVTTFEVISETDTEAVLRPDTRRLAEMLMQSDDDEDMDKQERKMVKKLLERIEGEVVLSKPDARMKSFKVHMTRSMTIMVVAKIKAMEIEQNCAMAPNGHLYGSDMRFSLQGKALGSKFGQEMSTRISDLTPLP